MDYSLPKPKGGVFQPWMNPKVVGQEVKELIISYHKNPTEEGAEKAIEKLMWCAPRGFITGVVDKVIGNSGVCCLDKTYRMLKQLAIDRRNTQILEEANMRLLIGETKT